ncbi:hypothetical protein [Caballeronia sp. S22]|uniref:hypothetical protein n=1 Tax=Caballeronia sp. S22 TaxID=3137182 RepID=UPI0035317D89
MKDQYFPALHLGDYPDPHTALASAGIFGLVADFCASGLDDHPDGVATYEASMTGSSPEPGVKTAMVLMRLDGSQTRIGFGFMDLPAETEDLAITRALETLVRAGHRDGDRQRFFAYRAVPPCSVLQ